MLKEKDILFDVCADRCLTIDRIIEQEVFVHYDNNIDYVFDLKSTEEALLSGVLIRTKGMY